MNAYLAAYRTTKEAAVHKKTQANHFDCQNTLNVKRSKHSYHADISLNDSLSRILSPSVHEYSNRVIYCVGQQTECL